MSESWFEKQARQRREYIARRLEHIETQTRQIQQAIGVTPDKVTNIEVESKEMPRGWVGFKRGKQRGMKKVHSAE